MIPEDHPDKRPLDERLAQHEHARREDAARWDPALFMDDPQAAIATEKMTGRYADRQRVFWGALALALAVWGRGRPSPEPDSDDARNAIEQTVWTVCSVTPAVLSAWPELVEFVYEAVRERIGTPPAAARELPLAAQAVAELLASEPKPAPARGWPPLLAVGDLLRDLRAAFTLDGGRQRPRLFWAAIWLALAAWGEEPSGWLDEPQRTRARAAIETAAAALGSRGHSSVAAAQAEVRLALGEARSVRSHKRRS